MDVEASLEGESGVGIDAESVRFASGRDAFTFVGVGGGGLEGEGARGPALGAGGRWEK